MAKRLTRDEMRVLGRKSTNEFALEDPSSLLDALNIEYREGDYRYYWNSQGGKRKDSANIYLDDDGFWKYHDYSTGAHGNVATLVMNEKGDSLPDATRFVINHFNTKDYIQEENDNRRGQSEINRSAKYREGKILENKKRTSMLSKLRDKNKRQAKEVKRIYTFGKFERVTKDSVKGVEYFNGRGLKNIPPNAYHIEYISEKTVEGKTSKSYVKGIGLPAGDLNNIDVANPDKLTGGDVHFFKPWSYGDTIRKTDGFKKKGISYMCAKEASEVFAIFESKNDYWAAASESLINDNMNVVISNGAGLHRGVIRFITMVSAQNESEPKLLFFNQNDVSYSAMAAMIVGKLKVNRILHVKYGEDEKKMDINDLVEKGVDVGKRIRTAASDFFLLQLKNSYDAEKFKRFEREIKRNSDTPAMELCEDITQSLISIKMKSVTLNHKLKPYLNKYKSEVRNSKVLSKILQVLNNIDIQLGSLCTLVEPQLQSLSGDSDMLLKKKNLCQKLDNNLKNADSSKMTNSKDLEEVIFDVDEMAKKLQDNLDFIDVKTDEIIKILTTKASNEIVNNSEFISNDKTSKAIVNEPTGLVLA